MVGTRHGEKLYETLLSREEMVSAEEEDHYYRVSPDDRDLNYDKYFSNGMVSGVNHDMKKIDNGAVFVGYGSADWE